MAPGLSEERKTGLHWLFCTGPGVIRLKKLFAAGCGVAIIITSILIIIGSFLDFTKWIGLIRYCWNCLFGFQMVLMQFKMEKWLFRHFGFLKGWFGKALFFLFVGTNIMNREYWWSYVVGGCCIFVGLVELAIGCKCADDEEGKDDQMTDEQSQAAAGGDQSGKRGRGRAKTKPASGSQSAMSSFEPTFSVNVAGANVNASASQVLGAAQCANSLANAVGGAAPSNDNPFFGNSHLANENGRV